MNITISNKNIRDKIIQIVHELSNKKYIRVYNNTYILYKDSYWSRHSTLISANDFFNNQFYPLFIEYIERKMPHVCGDSYFSSFSLDNIVINDELVIKIFNLIENIKYAIAFNDHNNNINVESLSIYTLLIKTKRNKILFKRDIDEAISYIKKSIL